MFDLNDKQHEEVLLWETDGVPQRGAYLGDQRQVPLQCQPMLPLPAGREKLAPGIQLAFEVRVGGSRPFI